MESKDIRHAPVVVFYGTDVPALYEVRRQYIAPDDTADVIRLEQPSAAEMMRQIETMDLFSTARRIEAVNPSWLVGAASEDRAVRQLLEKLSQLPPDTRVFIIAEGGLDRRKKSTKKILALAVTHQADLLNGRQLMQAFESYLRSRHARLEPAARVYVQQMTERWENVSGVFVRTESDKWLLQTPDGQVSAAIVRASLPTYMQHRVFAFWDDFLAGNLAAVLAANDKLFDGAKEELKNVGYVTSQLRLYLQIAELESAGMHAGQIAERLGINNAWRRKSVEQARRRIGTERARALLLAIYACQYARRTGVAGQSMRDIWIRYCG